MNQNHGDPNDMYTLDVIVSKDKRIDKVYVHYIKGWIGLNGKFVVDPYV